MNAQDLRKLLEQTDDKLSVFGSRETLNKYKFNAIELFDLISDFLSDEEKLKLFEYSHFIQYNSMIKCGIIDLVSDENIVLQMMNNDKIMNGFESYQIVNIIKKLSDNGKQELLHNQEFIKKHKIANFQLKSIVSSLSENEEAKILMDIDLIKNKLHLTDFQIIDLVKGLSSEEAKDKAIGIYKFRNNQKIDIIKSCSNSHKLNILISGRDYRKCDIISILQTLDIKTLSKFLVQHKEFCSENGLHPYEIIYELDSKQQKEFIENLENIDLTLSEKKEILVTLKEDVKQSIDPTNITEDCKSALSIPTTEYGNSIILDLERNLEDYRGLDNLISINPEEYTEEQRIKFIKLCNICPNMKVFSRLDEIVTYDLNAAEYMEAEEWISSILEKIKPEYSAAQKIAVIDNAIGRQISYAPDFGTEAFDYLDSRALWKIISSGYGVCNGIAKVEQNILSRVGIESKLVSSGTHTFLKLNDIELPLANGETVKGNTILDPTWNLTAHRFGGKPNNFCISYEQARQNDMDEGGKDHCCHKNDEELQDATLSLEEQSLRKLFTSVGLADKDGKFLIKDLLERSKVLHETYANNPEQNINAQFALLAEVCPEFAMCQDSSMSILSDVCLDNENLEFNKCTVSRVYEKTDEKQKPILYVYIDSNQLGEKFYFADKCQGRFVQLPQEEFVKRFECYEKDLEKNNGIRPWETNEKQTDTKSLANSSGNITIEEAEER